MRKIVGIGETVLDVIFRNDQPTAAVPGGSTFNALISLGRTIPRVLPDMPVLMVTEVGDDHIGDIVVSFMKRNNVRVDAVTRHLDSQTHVSMAFLDERNDAQYEFYKDHANARLCPDKVTALSFVKDDIVLFGSYFAVNPVIRDYTRQLLTAAREAGAILYYDINFRPSHLKELPEILPSIIENCTLADFVRGSAEDFQYLFGTSDGRRIYENHIRPLCRNFILTRGADPVEVFTEAGIRSFPVPQVETVSTIGAGDNFNAGFVYALATQDVRREGRVSLSADALESALDIATKFSSAACRTTFNYVDEDFSL